MTETAIVEQNQNTKLAELGITRPISFTKKEAEEATGIVAGKYFQYMQLTQALSKDKDLYGEGVFVVKRSSKDDKPVVLGGDFPAFVMAIRAKAMHFGKTTTSEFKTVMKETDNFAKFKEEAEKDRSMDNDYKAGLELLLWVPQIEKFVTYFATNYSTNRALEENVAQFCASGDSYGSWVKFAAEKQVFSKGACYVPTCFEAEIDEADVAVPSEEDLVDAIKRFVFPSASQEDEVDGAEKADAPKRNR